jgi:hypothetical protein
MQSSLTGTAARLKVIAAEIDNAKHRLAHTVQEAPLEWKGSRNLEDVLVNLENNRLALNAAVRAIESELGVHDDAEGQ